MIIKTKELWSCKHHRRIFLSFFLLKGGVGVVFLFFFMANKYKSLHDILFRSGSNRDLMDMHRSTSSSIIPPNKKPNDIEKVNLDWEDSWYDLNHWMKFNCDLRRVFVQLVRRVEENLHIPLRV